MPHKPASAAHVDLTGQVCLVTGGTRGIGATLALAAASSGATVCVLGRDEERLKTFVSAAHAQVGNRIDGKVADITDASSVFAAVAEILDTYGPISALVNNAGISKVGSSLDYDLADFTRILDVNVTGLFACSQAVARQMAGNGGGSIVNIASISSFIGQPQRAAYVASKSAVLGLTRALAVEWGSLGIRVNAIAPGYVRTDLTEELLRRQVLSEDLIAGRTPLGRFGETSDLVGALLFLLSTNSAFMTGQVVTVDGGWLANGYFQ